jgi:hypothetical protein
VTEAKPCDTTEKNPGAGNEPVLLTEGPAHNLLKIPSREFALRNSARKALPSSWQFRRADATGCCTA